MSLSDVNLALIRDEVGDTPDDSTLEELYADLAQVSWIPTALRVLRRRRAAQAGGEVKNVSLPGGLSIGLAGNLASLDRQIARLEAMLHTVDPDAEPDTAAVGRITRPGAGRR